MATVRTDDGWMTSFIYEQDLTSAYMNSVLYSLFRPGIYNANFILRPGTYSMNSASTNDGLSMLIKKGTTLVFSNDYLNVYEQSRYFGPDKTLYRRSFTCNVPDSAFNDSEGTLLGGTFPVIVKCVAMRDIVISGIAQAGVSTNDMSCQPWGASPSDPSKETTAPEVLYLCALMRYDQSGLRDFSSIPEFVLVRNNPYYGKNLSEIYYGKSGPTNPEDKEDSEYNRVFYYHTNQNWINYDSSTQGVWRIPDGSSTYGKLGLESLSQFSYLMIGALADCSGASSYSAFTEAWFRNHTFTARSLPEYRNNMIGASDTPSPDYIIPYKSQAAYNFGRLYIDFKNVLNFGNMYNTSIDWESAYRIAKTDNPNFFKFNELTGEENVDYVNLELTQEELGKIENTDESGTNNISLVMDFTFAVTKNVMNSTSNLDGKEDMFDNTSFAANNKIRLINHREIIGLNHPLDVSSENDSSSSDYSNIIQFVQIVTSKAETSEEDTSRTRLKLDICDNNSKRLLDLLKNNNILYRVVSKIRADGSLDAGLGESLIPVAVSFRLFGKASKTDSTGATINPADWGRTDWSGSSASQDYKDRCANLVIAKGRKYEEIQIDGDDYYVINFVGDSISSAHSVNPLNSVGLMDLEYKMTKMNAISTKTQDAYTILPVID